MPTRALLSVDTFLLRKIHDSIGRGPVQFRLAGNGAMWPLAIDAPIQVVIADRRTLSELLFNPELAFGDAYSDGRIEVRGDLTRLIEIILRSQLEAGQTPWLSRLWNSWLDLVQANTVKGSHRNIHRHYDLSANFYKLWLDSRMIYTCAYFPDPSVSLEAAQVAKMEHVCRKLCLRPDETVVEAGCGWGALALWMASHYGVRVRSFNISHEQILFARDRARQEGLSDRIEFVEDDYRNISGRYDAFVSVGMLEHVGPEHYQEFGTIIHRAIGNSGRGLVHFIGKNQPLPFSPWIRKRIFPGAYAPALRQVMDVFEPFNFSVLDVENLRPHYARTVEHWLSQFERSSNKVSAMFDSEFVRAWRLYLCGSIASFRVGNLQLFQVLFAGSQCSSVPWTRAHMYADDRSEEKQAAWIQSAS
ncbi:MAG TPA: cyclopropane-fatty-acyl-phospholipid synthase family protein [Candidatus Acidoferrum sp.]|nr:cyclopropane-fatty-acyl-phospholipid synthase family protein [Candidatus Acidoferrum sp.]